MLVSGAINYKASLTLVDVYFIGLKISILALRVFVVKPYVILS